VAFEFAAKYNILLPFGDKMEDNDSHQGFIKERPQLCLEGFWADFWI